MIYEHEDFIQSMQDRSAYVVFAGFSRLNTLSGAARSEPRIGRRHLHEGGCRRLARGDRQHVRILHDAVPHARTTVSAVGAALWTQQWYTTV